MTRIPVSINRPMTRIEAARVVQEAGRFEARVMIQNGQSIVNVKSMLGLLSLCTSAHEGLELVTDGKDESEAAAAVSTMLAEFR